MNPSKLKEFNNELRVDMELIRPRITKMESVYDEQQIKFNHLTCNKSYRKPFYKNA